VAAVEAAAVAAAKRLRLPIRAVANDGNRFAICCSGIIAVRRNALRSPRAARLQIPAIHAHHNNDEGDWADVVVAAAAKKFLSKECVSVGTPCGTNRFFCAVPNPTLAASIPRSIPRSLPPSLRRVGAQATGEGLYIARSHVRSDISQTLPARSSRLSPNSLVGSQKGGWWLGPSWRAIKPLL